MYKYNFVEKTAEWQKSVQAVGINDEYVALAQDDTIELCNLKGKTFETIDSTNVTVLDRAGVDPAAFEKKNVTYKQE